MLDSNSSIPNFVNQPDQSMLLVDCGLMFLLMVLLLKHSSQDLNLRVDFLMENTKHLDIKNSMKDMDSVFVKEDIVLIKFCQVDNINEVLERCSKKCNIWRKSIC